jgi:hypothetical protein
LKAPRQIREEDGQDRDRPDCEHEAGDGEVVLRHALLDEIPDRHEQDQVEGLQRVQLPPADDARQQEDEDEGEGCANDDVHQGYTVTARSTEVRNVSPS